MQTRIERDSMGEVAVPADRHWGAQTQRSLANFEIGRDNHRMPRAVVHAFGLLKLAAARANAAAASVKAVGALVPGLTRKAFEKFGFSTATLLTDWANIVGADLARYTAPDRLKWPRAKEDADGEAGPQRQGATLVLRVDLGRAIDVQYKARQITERINAHFGYRAVAEIRIIQAPVEGALPPVAAEAARATPAKTARRPFNRNETAPLLAAVSDDGLRAALERMLAGLTRNT